MEEIAFVERDVGVGVRYFGPFETFGEAKRWAERYHGEPNWKLPHFDIALLEDPAIIEKQH